MVVSNMFYFRSALRHLSRADRMKAKNMFYFHPDQGRWSNLTNNIFQMGWFNHQLVLLLGTSSSNLLVGRIGILHSLSFYFTSVAFYAAWFLMAKHTNEQWKKGPKRLFRVGISIVPRFFWDHDEPFFTDHIKQPVFHGKYNNYRWWSQIFFMFIPTWGRCPIWLLFFKWAETTYQIRIFSVAHMASHGSGHNDFRRLQHLKRQRLLEGKWDPWF